MPYLAIEPVTTGPADRCETSKQSVSISRAIFVKVIHVFKWLNSKIRSIVVAKARRNILTNNTVKYNN